MDILTGNFAWEDRISLSLGALFERYGFSRYRMGRFEAYDLYRENKNFLKSDTAITFTDSTGRLMALKPDVTMSIAKNAPESGEAQKLYYVENVFRKAPGKADFAEIKQIGLEYIGGQGLYPELETVLLAEKSLGAIDAAHVLSIGHMGFIGAALDQAGLFGTEREQALEAIRKKSPAGLPPAAKAEPCLRLLTELSAPADKALPRLKAAAGENAALLSPLEELQALCRALDALHYAKRLNIDFSIINDMDYYNGIVFSGYIRDIPRAVLSGGRYDKLMEKFKKARPALGFGVYLGELARAFGAAPALDADILLLTGSVAPERILQTVEALAGSGFSVRAAARPPKGFRAGRVLKLLENGETEEVDGNA